MGPLRVRQLRKVPRAALWRGRAWKVGPVGKLLQVSWEGGVAVGWKELGQGWAGLLRTEC